MIILRTNGTHERVSFNLDQIKEMLPTDRSRVNAQECGKIGSMIYDKTKKFDVNLEASFMTLGGDLICGTCVFLSENELPLYHDKQHDTGC